MYEEALRRVNTYLSYDLYEPGPCWSDYYFIERSYSRWAALEIINRIVLESDRLPTHISGHELRTPKEIVEEFVDQLERYSEMRCREDVRRTFIVARDAAMNILHFI